MPKPLFRILDDLATHHRKLVLVQGSKYWRIEDLVRQSKVDMVRFEEARSALTAPEYDEDERGGKIAIVRDNVIIFIEAGSDLKTV